MEEVMARKTAPSKWQNRIVGEGQEDPNRLMANPLNWRVHTSEQKKAIGAVLDKVGWVQRVIVNRTTGHVVDGHLRVASAISNGEPSVPVLYVELSPEEEALVLATLDPISAMAATDNEKLGELIQQIPDVGAEVEALLAGVMETDWVAAGDPNLDSAYFEEDQVGPSKGKGKGRLCPTCKRPL
jgi:hypothetical protein